MSDDAVRFLNAIAALSPNERQAVFVELARSSGADAGPVSEDELVFAGEEIFSMYDDEEAECGDTETG